MEDFLDVVIGLLPSLVVIVFILLLIKTYIMVKKYLVLKMEYYQYKLSILKKKNDL